MKYKILTSLLIMGLIASALGWGTFAYFSDTETSSANQMAAGTLNLQIKDSDQGFLDGSPVTASMSSPAGGLAPGDSFWTDKIYLRNTGTIAVWNVFLHFYGFSVADGAHPESEPTGADGYLMDKIILTAIKEYPNYDGDPVNKITTTVFDTAMANVYLAYWGAPTDGSISLADIVNYAEPAGSSPNTSFKQHTGDSTNPATGTAYAQSVPYIASGATAWIQFEFKLLEDTNNYAQGDIVSFNVDFIGTQTADQAP